MSHLFSLKLMCCILHHSISNKKCMVYALYSVWQATSRNLTYAHPGSFFFFRAHRLALSISLVVYASRSLSLSFHHYLWMNDHNKRIKGTWIDGIHFRLVLCTTFVNQADFSFVNKLDLIKSFFSRYFNQFNYCFWIVFFLLRNKVCGQQ